MYLKNDKTEASVMTDILIVLIVLALMAVYYYGLRAAAVIVLTTAVCCISDLICIKLRKKNASLKDISPLLTGLTLSLMMPASVPYFAAVAAAVFAIVVAKQAFGGHGCEIFNAAAAGFLFVSLCFPDNMLTYPAVFSDIPFSSIVPADILGQSMTKTFLTTGTSSVSFIDIILGKFRCPMGTGFTAIIAVGMIFLAARRSISLMALSAEIVVSGAAAFIFGGYDLMNVLYFFAGGMTIFGMIFLSCDYSIMPKSLSSRLLYGIIVGGLTALFHFYSATENAVVYAVIMAAPICVELDRRSLSFAEMLKKKNSIFSANNEPLKNMQETLEILDSNDKEG